MLKIPVILGNRSTRIIATPDQLEILKPYFRYRPPGYQFSPKYRSGYWDGYVCLLRYSRVPTGLFLDLVKTIQSQNEIQFYLREDERQSPKFTDSFNPKLEHLMQGEYAFQRDCVEAMIQASKCGGLILNATASGKTNIASLFFSRLVGCGTFVVDELTLLDQAYKGISAVIGKSEVGWIGGGRHEPKRITVATVQSLSRCKAIPQEAIVLDEFHLAMNNRTEEVIKALNPKAVYGLTATLELQKLHIRMEAVSMAGPPIYRYSVQTGVESGVLSKGITLLVKYPMVHSLGRIFSRETEYHMLISGNNGRNSLITEFVLAGITMGLRVVVLVERLAHLKALDLKLSCIKHWSLSGKTATLAQRVQAKTAMEQGKVNLILATRIFSKGINIKSLDMIIDATGLPSANNAQQRYGRGTRRAEGKQGVIYVDVSDRGGRYTEISASRERALRSLGNPVIEVDWQPGSAKQLLEQAKEKLK